MSLGMDRSVFSTQSQNSMSLWASLGLSDEDVDDTFTNGEQPDNHQTPLPPPGKCPLDSSDKEESPSKKAKLDTSNLYDASDKSPSQGDGGKTDGAASDQGKSKAHKPKKAKKSKKKKNKKD